MKKKTIVLAIIFVLMFTIFVSPVAAGVYSVKESCEDFGGVWGGSDPNSGTCSFSKTHFFAELNCGVGYGLLDTWESGNLLSRECVFSSADYLTQDFETTVDAKLDAWLGPCGVNVFSAPVSGTVTINKPYKQAVPQPAPNYSDICAVSYINSDGKTLDNWFSITKLYHNLDEITKGYFDNGSLNFYILKEGEWTICPNMEYLPNEGSSGYGRIACLSAGPTMFGIGTGLTGYSNPSSPPLLR